MSGEEFLEVVVLFLRMIPLYPEGHKRVLAVMERLQDVLQRNGASTEVVITDTGLRVGEHDLSPLPPGPRQFRDTLAATGVSCVRFQADAAPDSYVMFARSLQRNARLGQSGRLTFTDLWGTPIPGIELEEMQFDREGFQGVDALPGGATAAPRSLRARLVPRSATTEGEDSRAPSGGDGSSSDAADGPGEGPAPDPDGVPRVESAGKDVRALALEDAEILETLGAVERALMDGTRAQPAKRGDRDAADILEHVLRLLPLEAQFDPAKGLQTTRLILTRFLQDLGRLDMSVQDASGENHRRRALLLRSAMGAFPQRKEAKSGFPMPEVTLAPEDRAPRDDETETDPDEVLARASAASPERVPALDPDSGISDICGVLTHAVLLEADDARREVLRSRLVADLRTRTAGAPVPCLLRHLRDECAAPPATRDPARIRLLVGIAEEAGIDGTLAAQGWLPLEAIAAVFPQLLRTFVRAGGSAGSVARRLGRKAVLEAGPVLLGQGGALADPETVERILGERSPEMLPFAEVLIGATDPVQRALVLTALRRVSLPSLASNALRILPDDRLSETFLKGLCQDGFARTDSHLLDAEAVAGIFHVAAARGIRSDLRARVYATATLGTYPRELSEPVLRSLLGRAFLLPTQPREVRGAARLVLARYTKAPTPLPAGDSR